MAEVIPYALMAVSAVGTIMSANAQKVEGANQYEFAKVEAKQLYEHANDDRATSQRAAEEKRREAQYTRSRAIAAAAASGADALDPSVVDIVSGIDAEGDYNARSALFEGETAARSKETEARKTLFQGRMAKQAGRINSTATIIGGASTIGSMYMSTAGRSPSGSSKSSGASSSPGYDYGYSTQKNYWDR